MMRPVTSQPEHAFITDADAKYYQAHWEVARQWLYRQRSHAPANADIWHLRFHWSRLHASVWEQVINGQYRLSPMQVYHPRLRPEAAQAQWSACDALVLKWVSLIVGPRLPMQASCTHVAGHHAGRDALRQITQHLRAGMVHVWRTDIRGYYRHINKQQLYRHICRYITPPALRSLILQYIYYSVEDGGEFYTPTSGICRGCSLSPLLGGSFLWFIDQALSGTKDMFYVRYMDDFLVLSERRLAIRKARRQLLGYLDDFGFECHPEKTQVGRTRKGFDWLGVWFTDTGPTGIGPRAQEHYAQRRRELAQRCYYHRLTPTDTAARLHAYDIRWQRWADGQLNAAL